MYAATENTDARLSKKPRRDEAETCDCVEAVGTINQCVSNVRLPTTRVLQQLDHSRTARVEKGKRGDAGRVGYGLFADESIHAGEYIRICG